MLVLHLVLVSRCICILKIWCYYGFAFDAHKRCVHNFSHIIIGGVLDIFYPEWKMKIATNERLFRMTCQLWKEAYYHNGEELKDDNLSCCKKVYDAGGGDCNGYRDKDEDDSFKWHPFGSFDCNRGYMVS